MNYYIADLHFSHRNIIQFDKRPYQTIEQMNNDLIKRWNDVVTDRDDVYVLGDMFWNTDEAPMILEQLHGKIHLIKGNHDKITSDMMHYFASISGYAEINDDGNHLILCHYPIMFYNHSYSPNCWMLCGHVHNTRESTWLNEWKGELRDNALSLANNRGNIINAGCMLHDYTPKTINQLIEWDKSEVWRVTEV